MKDTTPGAPNSGREARSEMEAVVICAGYFSLACACCLAKSGQRVTSV